MLTRLADVAKAYINHQDKCGWTPLMIATQWPKPTLCSILLNVTGIYVNLTNAYHQSALWLATAYGKKEVFVRPLHCQDVDVNIADVDGNTPLMEEVVRKGKIYRLTRLLENTRLDINLQGKWYQTALMLAIKHNKSLMFDKLLATNGQNTILQNLFGETALHMTVKSSNLSYVQKLMAKSPDEINSTDYDGNTALYMAAGAGNQPIVEELLTAEGINVTLKNRAGEDALGYAVSQHHHNTARVIRYYMMQHHIGSIDDEIAIDLLGVTPAPLT